jgi:hypothetical protein
VWHGDPYILRGRLGFYRNIPLHPLDVGLLHLYVRGGELMSNEMSELINAEMDATFADARKGKYPRGSSIQMGSEF